jgi:hypothetical protein
MKEDQPGINPEKFKVKFDFPNRRSNSYPVITYSINRRSEQYKTFGFRATLWRRFRGEELRIFEGYHYQAEIVLCKEALDYLRPADIIQIRQKQWLVEARGQGFLTVRTTHITRQLVPITIGDPVFKLYSTYAEG